MDDDRLKGESPAVGVDVFESGNGAVATVILRIIGESPFDPYEDDFVNGVDDAVACGRCFRLAVGTFREHVVFSVILLGQIDDGRI